MNIEAHLNELPAAEAATLRTLVQRLRAVPEIEPSANLQPTIMRAIAQQQPRPPCRLWRVAVAIAALFIAAVTLLHLYNRDTTPRNSNLLWLAARQETDGSWNPQLHHADPNYRPALTALSLMALAREPTLYQVQIEKAALALCAMQAGDGSFGAQGRPGSYNLAMVSCALASIVSKSGTTPLSLTPTTHEAVLLALQRGVALSAREQGPRGGWDYENRPEGNMAITAWQVRALAAARTCGITQADLPLRKGLRWLRAAAGNDTGLSYNSAFVGHSDCLKALAAYSLMTAGQPYAGLPELGRQLANALKPIENTPPDCYLDYARCLAYAAAGSTTHADTLRLSMLRRLDTNSPDQWKHVGGTLYEHALTALVN